MALPFVAKPEWAGLRKEFRSQTLGNYTTGGYALSGVGHIDPATILYIAAENVLGYIAVPDVANKKIKFYLAAGTELTNGSTALNGQTLRYIVFYQSA